MEASNGEGKVSALVVYVQDQANKLYLGRMGWTLSVDKARPFNTERQAQSAIGAAVLFGALCGRMVLMASIESVMVTPRKKREKKQTATEPVVPGVTKRK